LKNTLYIFVENFSNKTRESFFEKELPYLSAAFKKVYVVPLYPDNTDLDFTADNVEVLNFNYFLPCNRIKVLFFNFFSIFNIFCFELSRTHDKYFYLKNFKSILNDLLFKFSAAKNLENSIKKDINSTTTFYSYWFMQWVIALSLIKLKHPVMNIVSRVHGADYDESQVKRTLPFRYFQLSKVNKIFSVSLFAKKYLEEKFRILPDKTEVARLGLLLNDELAPINNTQLNIVSCSSVIPLKRVEKIVDVLNNIPGQVKWTHFGDGPLLTSVKQKAQKLPANITCEFMGYVSNKEFLDYLKNDPISIFINVSESEGIPVTMMEAISFGIPIVGTNICGVPEIVNEQTGFLIPKDFESNTVASVICEAHRVGKIYSEDFRKKIQFFYKENFYAPINYKTLASKLLNS
jgi:glycosyltransferase involved in cell wall biosynthesis